MAGVLVAAIVTVVAAVVVVGVLFVAGVFKAGGSSQGSPPTFTVTFDESGLTAATNWSVTLNHASQSSDGSAIVFSEPDGSYAYDVTSGGGYSVTPSSGMITVDGDDVSEPISFAPGGNYTVLFGESGLASGSSWSVSLFEHSVIAPESSTDSSITFEEPVGSYPYLVTSVDGYVVSPSSGTVQVEGPTIVDIYFNVTILFGETGLAPGTSWSVSLFERSVIAPEFSTNSSIAFDEPAGTYPYIVASVDGYTASPPSGMVTAEGPTIVDITFVTPLANLFQFGQTFDDSVPSENVWEWELTDHVNITGQILMLGEMDFTVGGSNSGEVANITAYDTANEVTGGVFTGFNSGSWSYETGYNSSTQVGNQFIFLIFGYDTLDGVTVTLECPGTDYGGAVSVTISD